MFTIMCTPPPRALRCATSLRRRARSDRFAANSPPFFTLGTINIFPALAVCLQADAARFLKETDKTALRTTKLAAKLAVQLGKAEAKASAGGAAIASAEAASLLEPENMDLMAEVLDERAALAAGQDVPALTAGGASGARGKLTKREMGLLRWGKKNHKVGNKDPYGNPDAETVTSFGPAGAKVAGGGKKGRRGKKKDGFTRVTMPHHQTYSGPA